MGLFCGWNGFGVDDVFEDCEDGGEVETVFASDEDVREEGRIADGTGEVGAVLLA